MHEKFQLLIDLLTDVQKTFAVCFPDIGENADRGLNYFFKILHFIGLRNACFKNGQVLKIIHLPHREWNTDL